MQRSLTNIERVILRAKGALRPLTYKASKKQTPPDTISHDLCMVGRRLRVVLAFYVCIAILRRLRLKSRHEFLDLKTGLDFLDANR